MSEIPEEMKWNPYKRPEKSKWEETAKRWREEPKNLKNKNTEP